MKIRKIGIILGILIVVTMVSCKKEHQHDFDSWQLVTEATCEEEGLLLRYCKNCNEVEEQTIEALGHDATDATCMAPSYCKRCEKVLGTVVAHQYGNWETVSEPTCLKTGSKKHSCSVCGHMETQIISSLDHQYTEYKIIKNATCSSEGLKERTCLLGGEVQKTVIEKIPHQYKNWEIIEDATCEKEGLRKRVCSDCHHIEVETIKKLDHIYTDWAVKEIATCYSFGIEERECEFCHHTEQRLLEELEHQFENIGGQIQCEKCGYAKDTYDAIEEAKESVVLEVSTTNGVNFPSEVSGVQITWKSCSPDIITDEGFVYADSKKRKATIIGSYTYNQVTKEVKYEIDVPAFNDNTIAYAWDVYYSKKFVEYTVNDVYFLWKDYGDCVVLDYESSNVDVMSHSGMIYQQVYDQTVLVTARFQRGKIIQVYEKEIIVGAYTDIQRVNKVAAWIPEKVEELKSGTTNYLPVTHEEYGTTIQWYSLEAGVIAGNGVFVKPLIAHDVTIYCTVLCGSDSKDMRFVLPSIGGNMTKLMQVTEWMKGQLPTQIMGTKNFVLENDALDYQIRIHSGGVLNLIDGSDVIVDRSKLIDTTRKDWENKFWGSGTFGTTYHPSVPQDVLDKMMYTGYIMPNPQNILWITIHESGMPRVGNDAKLLADVQLQTAKGERDREASWNYQVDENKIYQSFEDEVICWHAGDGTATRGNGNNNSIGIEMCINGDGNYDGAMYHDAKLVASLLHKYNLTLANVKRHYDWSGKICPNYMITQGRWTEFLSLVDKEYTAMQLLKDAQVTWTVTTDTNSDTDAVLNQYFTKGASTLWYSKPVSSPVTLHITMTIVYEGTTLVQSSDLVLLPD